MTAEAHKLHVLVRYTAQKAMDILGLQRHREIDIAILVDHGSFGRFDALWLLEVLPLGVNLVDGLLLVLGGLAGPTAVLGILATTACARRRLEHHLPAALALEFEQMGVALLVDEQFSTLETDATQNLHHKFEELRIVHGSGELEMAKVTGTMVVGLSARATDLTVLQNTHTGVKQPSEFAIGRRWIRNFAHRPS